MSWLNNLKNKLNKTALEKLPEEELQSGLPPPPDDPSGEDPAASGDPSQDPALMDGMDPSAMMDPSMMMPPMPEPKPKVWDNKYEIHTDHTKFIVELTPSIVMDPASTMPPAPPPEMPPAQTDPMSDTSLNPNADPELLKQWMHESDDNDKAFSHGDQGTVDPLSQQQEGISDTGNEQSVKVHNKTSAFLQSLIKLADDGQETDADDASPTAITPGADRSNAYPPCKYCANFNAAENSCTQGLDVEKVQAAKSCSWLNSTMTPFNGQKDPDSTHKDKDSVVSDVADLPGGGQNTARDGMTSMANLNYNKKDKALKDYLDKIWD